MDKKTLWEIYTPEQLEEMEQVSNRYKECIDAGKTERECVRVSVEMARKAGYVPLDNFIRENKALKAGDKVYAVPWFWPTSEKKLRKRV